MIICSEEAARWSQQPCCLQVVTVFVSYVEHPLEQQDVCGWPWSASSTLSSSHLPHLASHQCSKFGKVVFCEVALCPGMQWGRLSSKQGDLWFVPLAGTHYTESECCFHVVFHLSLGFEQSLGAPRKERTSKFPKKGRKPRALRAVPGSGIHPFPGEDGRSSFSTANSEKSNLKH